MSLSELSMRLYTFGSLLIFSETIVWQIWWDMWTVVFQMDQSF